MLKFFDCKEKISIKLAAFSCLLFNSCSWFCYKLPSHTKNVQIIKEPRQSACLYSVEPKQHRQSSIISFVIGKFFCYLAVCLHNAAVKKPRNQESVMKSGEWTCKNVIRILAEAQQPNQPRYEFSPDHTIKVIATAFSAMLQMLRWCEWSQYWPLWCCNHVNEFIAKNSRLHEAPTSFC